MASLFELCTPTRTSSEGLSIVLALGKMSAHFFGFDPRNYWQRSRGSESGKGIKGVLSRELLRVIYSLALLASSKENHLLEAS